MISYILLGIIGPWQIVLILAIVVLFFGGRKIPELMKGLGKGVKEFKKGVDEADLKDDDEKKEIK
jgi:sec-independent protein translocase protein TatA